MDELLADIKAGRLDPIYVLHSEHPILIERAVSAIRDAAVPPAARGFNYDVVEGKPSAARIVALAQTLPMMAKRRMVFVRDLARHAGRRRRAAARVPRQAQPEHGDRRDHDASSTSG